MEPVFLRYLIYFFLVVIAHYSVGYVVERIFKINYKGFFQTHFFRLLSGVFISVFAISLFYTHGNTVMLGLIIPFLFLLVSRKNAVVSINPSNNLSEISIVLIFIGGLAIFLIQYFTIYNGGEFPLLPDADTLFYSNVSNYLSHFKTESLSLDFLQMQKHGCEPYHFFDIWINTYCKDILRLNSFLTFKLVVYPLNILIVFLGFCAMAEQAGFRGWLVYLFSFLFLFFSGLYFPFYDNIKHLSASVLFSYNVFTYSKLCYVYILLQATVINYNNGLRRVALVFLATLPLLYITLLPSVVLSIFMLALNAFFKNRNWINFLKDITPATAISLFILVFYLFQPKAQTVNSDKFSEILSSFFSIDNCKVMVNVIGLTLMQISAVYIPLLLIIILTFSAKEILSSLLKNEIVFAGATLFITPLFCWALFHVLGDSIQLFFNISIPLIAISCFSIILISFKRLSIIKETFVIVLLASVLSFRVFQFYNIIMQMVNPYSLEYLNKTNLLVKNNFSSGAFLLGGSDYKSGFTENAVFSLLGSYLVYENDQFFPFSLSFPKSNGISKSESGTLLPYNSAFSRFVENQKATGKFQSLGRSRLDFIDFYRINFIFISKNAIVDSVLKSRINKTVVDSNTGEQFCIIIH